MASAEGGATPSHTTSSYGGGGVGGKFRKKPLRRQATPYDRPATAYLGTTSSSSSSTSGWFTKLFVDPASKLISYGANRFVASVRKRLPQPPPEVNSDASEGVHRVVIKNPESAQEPAGEISMATDNFRGKGIYELEQLLKRKTFSRSEIAHLTELLESRAVEMSARDDAQNNEVTAPDLGQHEQLSSGPAEENKIEGIRSSADMLTHPLNSNSKVLGDDIATPAELAKAYMGSRPSKASSSVLGIRQQGGKEDIGLLGNRSFTSQTSVTPLANKGSHVLAVPQNGFVTPRSRGRSAIYNMARTPYFGVHPTSAFKGSRKDGTGNTGPSMPSSTLPLAENDEKFDFQPTTLKRRSSVLEDEVGSIGSIRRIRHKSNLLAPKIYHSHELAIGSRTKQKLQLVGEPSHKVLQAVGETESEIVPRTRLARVPSKSSEVAARIFQHLEKLTPKEKSSESKLVAVRERSPMKLTSGMLSGQAFRNMEDVDLSKLLTGGQHDHKLGDSSISASPNSNDSSFQKPRNIEENGPKESVAPTNVSSSDTGVSFAATPTTITTEGEIGATRPPQKKRAFRMSAPEDSLEQDDVHYNAPAPTLSSEKMGTLEDPPTDKKSAPAEVPKSVKTTMPASEEATATPQSVVVPFSTAAFGKPVESNSPSLFNFSSNSAEKFPALPSEYSKKIEPKVESSSSLVDVSALAGSQGEIPESDKFGHMNPQAGDTNDKSHTVSHAGGPQFSSSSPVSISATASDVINEISTRDAVVFTSSTSISAVNPTSIAPSGSIFGLAGNPSNLAEPLFKFGTPSDPAASASNIFEISHTRTKVGINSSSGSSSVSNSSVVAPDATNGSSTPELGSSVGQPTVNLQGSISGSASKPVVFGVGTVSQGTNLLPVSSASSAGTTSQGTSVLPFSSAPSPFFPNGINPSGSLSNPQVISPNSTFSFSSAASSSDTNTALPGSGATSSVFRFGASPISEGTAVASTSASTPGVFSFGLNSLSSSTSAAGANSSSSLPKFNFGGSSSASASVASAGSSFSSSTSGMFNFGGSSSTSLGLQSIIPDTGANGLGSSVQSPASSIFGSSFASASPSTGFAFGASSSSSSVSSTLINNTSSLMPFNSSAGASSSPFFSFTTGSASVSSSQSLPSNNNNSNQPTFGNLPTGGFTPSSGNNDQMNAEDSMAEDPVQSSSAPVAAGAVFGQSSSVSPGGFTFGSTVPSQPNPFMFGSQHNQVPLQNPSPFQASSSLEFNAGGSFSLGSGGGDKSGRRIVKINRSKNRKR